MSVIQQIQEKYAKVMAVIIALALITFVVMLAFENGNTIFGGPSNVIGKVNGEKIDVNEFGEEFKKIEDRLQASQQTYGLTGPALTQRALQETWDREVNKILLNDEAEKLGIGVSAAELDDMLFGVNPPADVRQMGTDPQTGQYNAEAVRQRINEIKRGKDVQMKQQLNDYLVELRQMRLSEKYNSLLLNSINYPKWIIEKQNQDNAEIAKISFVRQTYAAITDSSKITDKEIEDYVNKHQKDFKQTESRSIAYVSFSALPTADDTAATREAVLNLKPEFDSTKDAESFLVRNGSSMEYSSIYFPKSKLQQANQSIQMSNKDTLFSLAKGAVYGPYLDGGAYVLAKMIDMKVLPDSVKCRHILLGTTDRQGQPIMADSIAKFKADSVAMAIAGGASFDSLEAKYSTDEAAGQEKGVMTFASTDIQGEGFAKEFGQFILFDGKPGDKKVVKTNFGYHYIEIMSFIGTEPHYNIAYMSKNIDASQTTTNAADAAASSFAATARDAKEFEAAAEKLRKEKGINKNVAMNITPASYEIQGLGFSRQFIKNIYKAKKGQVLSPELVGENYIVALVTEVNEEGVQSASQARLLVEPLLRNKKKAEIVKKKLGTITTLEAASAALGGQPIEVADSVRFTGSSSSVLGFEPKVIGAAFNKANAGKVVTTAIAGSQGVYVIRVDNVSATPVADANVDEQRKSRYEQAKMQAMYQAPPSQALKEAAKIKDYRGEFY